MALMNMHANLLIKLIILLKIHLSSQGHFCNDFNMFLPLVMHCAIENHFCSPLGKLWPKRGKRHTYKWGGSRAAGGGGRGGGAGIKQVKKTTYPVRGVWSEVDGSWCCLRIKKGKPKSTVCRILAQWVECWRIAARSGGPVLIGTIQESFLS